MVQVVDRTFDILEQIVAAPDDVSVSELHDTLGLPIGTVHRLLAMLTKRGYAVQDPRTRRYGPGPKLVELGARATSSQRFHVQQISRPHLEALMRATGETSNLVVLRSGDGVYLDQVAGAHLVRMFTEIGNHAPLYCTGAGKAMLAGFTADELDQYLAMTSLEPWTSRTITDPAALRADVVAARERGYAIDDEEREAGVRCVAAPVFDHRGRCSAAISVSGPTTRMTPDAIERAGRLVEQAASTCSAALGYGGSAESRASP